MIRRARIHAVKAEGEPELSEIAESLAIEISKTLVPHMMVQQAVESSNVSSDLQTKWCSPLKEVIGKALEIKVAMDASMEPFRAVWIKSGTKFDVRRMEAAGLRTDREGVVHCSLFPGLEQEGQDGLICKVRVNAGP